ncbi:outer membrane protein assembly factor BamB family protein [Thalassoglobus neptunius]|uniref:outer membrane protein assembly factor BamB family protein n=1 Tax=Thalassoglobus neptunius TaxID=1938619 RepID=UPI0018D1FB51|nr:PQQ-binding-like beta-propeller repeat protein [Thalassoglobus neptunius]
MSPEVKTPSPIHSLAAVLMIVAVWFGSGLFTQLNADDEVVKAAKGWTSFRNGHQNLGIADGPLSEELELKWEYTTPDGTASTPVIADGRTYVGTLSGDIHCFELSSGELVWTYRSVDEVAENDIPPGFNAALALNSTTVFGGDDFGTFRAVDRKTGARKWTLETEAEIVGGAQVVGDNVIFGSHDGLLYCLNAETGEKVWTAEAQGPVNATPTIHDGETFTTGCDQPVLRVFDIQQGKSVSEVPIDALLIASAAAKDGILYFGTDGGSVHALPIVDGVEGWTFSIPGREQQMHSSPVVTEDVVLIGSRDKHVHCIDRKTGELKWSFATRGRVDSSPVIAGDKIYFGSADRNIYGVNLSDGKEVWKFPAKQSITGSPAIASGYLVIGTDSSNGRILCFGSPSSE